MTAFRKHLQTRKENPEVQWLLSNITTTFYSYFISEFLNLSWMKEKKNTLAPNILRVTQRFNEVRICDVVIR